MRYEIQYACISHIGKENMKAVWRKVSALVLTAALLLVPLRSAAVAAPYFGDADGNGALSSTDARQVMLYIVGEMPLDPAARALADYNEDFAADSSDVRAALLATVTDTASKPAPTLSEADTALLYASAYNGEPYAVLNGNEPLFTARQKTRYTAYEEYASPDALGRCGAAYTALCRELMPTEDRESISSVTPTGWHNAQYDCVSGGWLYNRSHIVGFQLAGEQANKKNLITGTKYLNVSGMLPFENMIADYIKETDNHVLYRVTPHFVGDNLLCEGVQIEAWSVEDNGAGICLNVFCYNVQPGVVLDYATGENYAEGEEPEVPQITYILNTSSKKFHLETCRNAASISEQNRSEYTGDREELIALGYAPCGNCDP